MSNTAIPISKLDINKERLAFIKERIFEKYDCYNDFRKKTFPNVRLSTFRSWWKKPYYLSDKRLCKMEQALGISESTVAANIERKLSVSADALAEVKGIKLSIDNA